jgi:hypothetical protein
MSFNSHKWIKSFKRSRAVSRKPVTELLKIAGKEVESMDTSGNDPEKWSIKYTDGSKEPYLKHIRDKNKIKVEDTNIFSADDEQSWPSGPFGKKDDYADEAGSSYKRSKDWQTDKPGEDIPTKGTGYKA